MITGKEDSSGQHLHFPSLTGNIAAAGAVDREFGDILGLFFFYFGPEIGSRRPGGVLKGPWRP